MSPCGGRSGGATSARCWNWAPELAEPIPGPRPSERRVRDGRRGGGGDPSGPVGGRGDVRPARAGAGGRRLDPDEAECRCELRRRPIFRGGSPRAIAHYGLAAVPGWEAVAFDMAAIALPTRGTSMEPAELQRARPVHRHQPLDTGVQPLRHGRDRQPGRRLDLRPAALPRERSRSSGTADRRHVPQGIASVGLVAVQAASGQVRRHSPATAISSTIGNGLAPGPSSGPRCATPLTSSTNSATSRGRSCSEPRRTRPRSHRCSATSPRPPSAASTQAPFEGTKPSPRPPGPTRRSSRWPTTASPSGWPPPDVGSVASISPGGGP